MSSIEDVFSGMRRVERSWHGLRVEYAWLPPFFGHSVTQPNRLEVVFSAHASVALEQHGVVHEVAARPGSCYVVGPEPTTLLRVPEYSDTLEMYPDMELLRTAAADHGIPSFELEPTVRGRHKTTFASDPIVLGTAHLLRRACMGAASLSDVGASEAAHILAARVLHNQHGIRLAPAPGKRLDERQLRRVADYIEANLERRISLEDMAPLAAMSPFHFCRTFKRTTGLAPHQFVQARRIDLAKRKLTGTELSVPSIAASIGFENVSHFRKQFAAHFGVTPGQLRAALGAG